MVVFVAWFVANQGVRIVVHKAQKQMASKKHI